MYLLNFNCFFSKTNLSLCQQHASYDSLSCSLYFSIRDSRQPVRLFIKLILILYQSIESYQMCHSNEISLAESRKLQLHVVFSLLQLISFFLNFYFWHPEERDMHWSSQFWVFIKWHFGNFIFSNPHVKTCGTVPFCSPLIPSG